MDNPDIMKLTAEGNRLLVIEVKNKLLFIQFFIITLRFYFMCISVNFYINVTLKKCGIFVKVGSRNPNLKLIKRKKFFNFFTTFDFDLNLLFHYKLFAAPI